MVKSSLITLLFFLADRFLKYHAYNTGSVTINRGVAFGRFPELSLILTGAGFLLLILFWFTTSLRVHPKSRSVGPRRLFPAMTQRGFLLILLGGLSNLLDRCFYGGVADYIRLGDFLPNFNLGDVMIVVGVGMLVWETTKSKATQ